MESRRIAFSLVTPCLFLASVGLARVVLAPTTWIVAAGGGGNFTDIQPAIDAASDGDLILIQAGSYSAFTLDKGLTLIGAPGVFSSNGRVQAATGPASLADMRIGGLAIEGCDFVVVGDGLDLVGSSGVTTPFGAATVVVTDCADVRFVDTKITGSSPFDGTHGLYAVDSRVEMTSSKAAGGDGDDEDQCSGFGYAGNGGTGLVEDGASRVHTTLGSLQGGDGGDMTPGFCGPDGDPGFPGHGAVVAGGELIAAGGDYTGGNGGKVINGPGCTPGGTGVFGTPAQPMRHSGTSFFRGLGPGSCPDGKALAIANITAVPADPTLERLSDPVVGPGKTVTLRVTANPGSFTRLFLGTVAQVSPTPNTFLELLLVKQTSVGLGFIPASGFVDYQLSLDPSAGYPPGTTLYAQAVANYPGEHRRTNSLPLVLR